MSAIISDHVRGIIGDDNKFSIDVTRVRSVDKYVTEDDALRDIPSITTLTLADTEHFLVWWYKFESLDDLLRHCDGKITEWNAWVSAVHAEFAMRCNDLLFK